MGIVSAKVPDSDKRLIDLAAAACDETRSAFIRRTVVPAAEEELRRVAERHRDERRGGRRGGEDG